METETPAKKSYKKWWIIAGVVVLLIIIGSLMGGSPSKTSATSPTTAKAPLKVNTTEAKATTTTVAPLVAWVQKNYSIMQMLSSQVGAVSSDMVSAGSSGQYSDLLAACQNLGGDAQMAARVAQAPDPSVEQHWSASLTYLNSASQDCVQGVNQMDVGLIQKMNSDIASATSELRQVATAVNS